MTVAKASSSNTNPVYHEKGLDLRIYAGGTAQIVTKGDNFTKIVFNISAQGQKRLAEITSSSGTVSIDQNKWTVTWTGDARDVTFTVGATSVYGTENDKAGQFCFSSIEIETTPVVEKQISTIEITGTPKLDYYVGEKFSTDGLALTVNYTDGSKDKDVTTDVNWAVNPDTVLTLATTSVTVTATYKDKEATETYNVNVTDKPVLAGRTFELITSIEGLVDGANYIILTSDGNHAASAVTSKKISTVAAGDETFALDGNVATVTGDNVAVYTLTASGKKWKISDGNDINTASGTNISYGSATEHTITFENKNVNIVGSSSSTRLWLYQIKYTDTQNNKEVESKVIGNYASSNATNADYLTIRLYKETNGVSVEAPVFTPEAGIYGTTQTVKVKNYDASLSYYYTLDGTKPSTGSTSYDNEAGIKLAETTTLSMIAVDGNGNSSRVTTAEYVFPPMVSIEEYQVLGDNTAAAFKYDAVVLAQGEQHMAVKDQTGYMLVYNYKKFDKKYAKGDVIPAGFTGTKTTYAREPELMGAGNLKDATGNVEVEAEEFTGESMMDHEYFMHYLVAHDATLTIDTENVKKGTITLNNGTALPIYNRFNITVPSDLTGKKYHVYGVMASYVEKGVFGYNLLPTLIVPVDDAAKVTLAELCSHGVKNITYNISDQLQVVAKLTETIGENVNTVLLMKDKNGSSVNLSTNKGLKDYTIEAWYYNNGNEVKNEIPQGDYDQSNWVEVVIPAGVNVDALVNKLLAGSSLTGTYTNTINPRLELTAEQANKLVEATATDVTYTPNVMVPANFVEQTEYYFMPPKKNELIQLCWSVYKDGSFYCPAKDIANNMNGIEAEGVVAVADYRYNSVGEPQQLTNLRAYQFLAIVKRIETAQNAAPRKVGDLDRDIPINETEKTSNYVIYPVNLDPTDDTIVTGIDGVDAVKAVASVKYYNLQGVQFDNLQPGLNIVVTRYTDGTTIAHKIVK